jgi:hypothetical protein
MVPWVLKHTRFGCCFRLVWTLQYTIGHLPFSVHAVVRKFSLSMLGLLIALDP